MLKERQYLSNSISSIKHLKEEHDIISEFVSSDDSFDEEELSNLLDSLYALARRYELECFFDDELDSNSCYMEINSGAGGTESDDWAMMLSRIYQRWAQKHGYEVKQLDLVPGEEAGIKKVIYQLSCPEEHPYGLLKVESGIHRLVRISPFNAAGKRHTSFASVFITPVIDDNIKVDISPQDLRIDTYKSSGAGGQHVNTTDSGVRITHLPTGLVVQSQNSRSQHSNKAECMKLLRSKLYELELSKKREGIDDITADKTSIGWGYQIRSYVLHPYQMVKDLRTGYQEGDTNSILDGNIDKFLYEGVKFTAIEKQKRRKAFSSRTENGFTA